MIEIKNLTKIYRTKSNAPGVKAVDDISLTLGNSGLVFVLGRSGGGKSTFLNLLGGLDEPSAGEIIVDGTCISSLGKAGLDSYRNTYVGFAFQEYNLLEDRTVKANVSLALSLQGETNKDRVDECLKIVGMDRFQNRKCTALSGGQKQRVALARALVKEPKMVLADEPTGALDSVTGTEIMGLLKDLSRERLVVVVSHDRAFAEKFADRIIEIADGKVISDSLKEEKATVETPLSLKKSKLRFGSSLLMAFRSLGSKTSRLVTTMLLSVSAFAVFGVGNAVSNIDAAKAITSAVDASNNKEICIRYGHSDAVLQKVKEDEIREKTKNQIFFKEVFDASKLNGGEIKVVDKGAKNELVKQSPYTRVYDITEINSFTCFDENDLNASGFDLEGSFPILENEIAISKVVYDGLSRSVGLSTYEGLVLNVGYQNIEYKVVGVVDNHFDSSKYDGLKKRDLEKNEELNNQLESDLENGFSSTVYVSKTFYEKNCSEVYAKLCLNSLKDGFIDTIGYYEIPTIAGSLEALYKDYECFVAEDYCLSHDDFDFDKSSGKITISAYWLNKNGYEETGSEYSSDHKYTYTVSDPDGNYVVEYQYDSERGVWLKHSEKDDPRIVEAINIDLGFPTKREFLEKCFVMPKGHKTEELLQNEESFINLSDDEVICSYYQDEFTNEFSSCYYELEKGNSDLESSFNEKGFGLSKLRAIFFDGGLYGTKIFKHNLVVSQSNCQYLEHNSEGAHAIKAVLTDDSTLNREFISYFMEINPFIVWHHSSKTVYEYSGFFGYPTDVVYLATIITLAVMSSLILMNFIGISISYGKKEMGILRALGARNKDILFVYFLEGLLIALIDGFASIAVSLVACSVINYSIGLSLGFKISMVSLSFFEPLVIFALSILSSLVAVSFPIWRNKNKKPVDAIRG